jgi:hypothetical protein
MIIILYYRRYLVLVLLLLLLLLLEREISLGLFVHTSLQLLVAAAAESMLILRTTN